MNNHIRNIIDSIIRSHATKIAGHYSCEVQDMSEHDIRTLSQTLFNFDEHFREIVKDYIDELIQSRIMFVQSQDNHNAGLIPLFDKQTGEMSYKLRSV